MIINLLLCLQCGCKALVFSYLPSLVTFSEVLEPVWRKSRGTYWFCKLRVSTATNRISNHWYHRLYIPFSSIYNRSGYILSGYILRATPGQTGIIRGHCWERKSLMYGFFFYVRCLVMEKWNVNFYRKSASLICKLDYNTDRLKCFANSCYEFWSGKKFRVTAIFHHFLVYITRSVIYTIF